MLLNPFSLFRHRIWISPPWPLLLGMHLAFWLVGACGLRADLFVAPNGVNDTAVGRGKSLGMPYKTIDYAADRAVAGETVYIRTGTYREAITPSRSGTANAPIIFKPYNNETVIVTGLNLITPGSGGAGQWAVDTGSVYKIQLTSAFGSDSNYGKERIAGCQVWVDGEPMSEARWPNAPTPMGIRRTEAATAAFGARTPVGTAGDFNCLYQHAGLNAFAADKWKDGLIVFAPGAQWYRRVAYVTGNTPAGTTSEVRFTFNPYNDAANREDTDIGDPFFLMGRRVALDVEREFFFDTMGATTTAGRDGPRHMLYLRMPGSVSPAGHQIEMRTRQFAISLGAVSNLRFENLRIVAGRIKMASNTSNCVFRGLDVQYPAYTWNEELGNDWDGVIMQGTGNQILDSVVDHCTNIGIHIVGGNNHVVRNTVVTDCFLAGIQVERESSNVRVENVTTYDLAGTGISGEGRPHKVLFCHGYQSALFTTDCGLLNAGPMGDGLGSEWAYNWMHTALGSKSAPRDWYGSPAIRLDAGFEGDGPSNFVIHHNVAWNTTQPGSVISIWALRNDQTNYQSAKIKLYNNTVDEQIGFTETFNAPASVKGMELINNLCGVGMNVNSSSTDAMGKLYLTDMVIKNNLFPNITIADNPTPPHAANRRGATGWINSTQPPYGYELGVGSQAINNGAIIAGITDGYLGSAPDIGALEYGRSAFTPGAKLRPEDLAALTITPVEDEGSVRFVIAGLPKGRSLPDTFLLKIGGAVAGAGVAQTFDFVNHTVTARSTAQSNLGANQTVQISLDGTTFYTLPATVTVPELRVIATFSDGDGTSTSQQFPGTAGSGWLGGWSASGAATGDVTNTTPLRGGGNYLSVLRSSGTSGQEGVSRQWSPTVRPTEEFTRLVFDVRLDSTSTTFDSTADNLSITARNVAGAATGNESSFFIRVYGAATGSLQAREWGIFNGDPGVVTNFDVARFVPTGLICQPGVTYTFTVDLFAATAAGTTEGHVHGTYDVTISDGTSTVKVEGAGFRSGSYASGPYLAFATQQSTTTDNLRFSVDSITMEPTPPNEPPTISAIAAQNTSEDTATGAIAFTVGDLETSAANLTVTRASSNTALVPVGNIVLGGTGASRTVNITPALNQSGTSTITLTVTDAAGATASRAFAVNVAAVNDPPTISAIAAQTINEDANTGAITVSIADVETAAASLTLTRASSNLTLVPLANVVLGGSGANRTVTVTPAANASGTATITLTVADGNGGTATSAFLLTVNAINDAPTISAVAARTINEDTNTGAIAITIGDVETAAGSLTLSKASSNLTLVPVANMVFGGSGANRTLTVTPAANASGTATLTVTVADGNGGTASSAFLLTVNAVNDVPTISAIAARTINEDANTGAIAFTIGDVETAAASLTLSRASSNLDLVPVENIVFGGTGASRTVTVTPLPNASGAATITLTVNDGTDQASSAFLVTVTAVNDPPTISAIAAQTINEDTSTGAISLTIGDVETAATGLVLSATSSNVALIGVPQITFGGSGAARTVSVTPLANQSGAATITVTVSDGSATASTAFLVTVNAVNDIPSIAPIADQIVEENGTLAGIAFSIADIETASSGLTLAVTSSKETLIPISSVRVSGTGNNRTLGVVPALDQSGAATITLTVTDALGATASTVFTVTVTPPSKVTAFFTNGAGTADSQQYPGRAGSGWLGPWMASAATAPVAASTTPLRNGGGYLSVVRTGGTSGQEGIYRQWSSAVRPTDQFTRITFDVRLDATNALFGSPADNFSITARSGSGATTGNDSSFFVRVNGGANGPLGAREWGVFNGDPGVTNNFDIARFVPTGMLCQPGVTYTFTVDVYAAAAAGTTDGRVHGTYDVAITDGTQTVNVRGAGFRTASYQSGNYLAFTTQQSLATDGVTFSVDGIVLENLVPEPLGSLASWKNQHFAPDILGNPTLESARWGNTADYDADGSSNLLEYALGTDPVSRTSVWQPVSGVDDLGHLTLEFTRIADPTLLYEVLASSDLVQWTPIWSSTGAYNVEGTVIVADIAPVGQSQRFLRLRVTAP